MATHLDCEQLLEDTGEEYKKLADALKALLRGEGTGEEVKATADSILNRTNELIDDYYIANDFYLTRF